MRGPTQLTSSLLRWTRLCRCALWCADWAGSILLGHQSVRNAEKHYAPWVRSRQEQLEADLTNAWSRDPLIALETRGTRGVHGKNHRPNW